MGNAFQNMFENFLKDIIGLVAVLLFILLVYAASKRITRTKGRNVTYHAIYGAITVVSFILIPMEIKDIIFTPLSVVVVGTAYPIYESLRAVCTIEEGDDTVWLSYWIAQGLISFSTEWVDGIGNNVQVHWNMFEWFFYLWLLLPYTDGATLIFDFIMAPFIAPVVQPIAQKMDGVINKLVMAVMNAAHLSVVWIAFVFLPQGLKRAVWIMIATVFPLMSSVVSVTTPEGGDDTYWLTYWSCFGVLFLIADFVENFLGFIPGFYTILIAVTVYLMLPLFRGANEVRIYLSLNGVYFYQQRILTHFIFCNHRYFVVFLFHLLDYRNCWFAVMPRCLRGQLLQTFHRNAGN